ncbi:MAG TPA: hypothetical protein VE913_24835 [Longimicrobium sp.]|nr:hypothetical protein [Longimicrobium sp.]
MRTLFPGRMLVVAIALLVVGRAPAHAQLRSDLFTGGLHVRVTTPDLPRERTAGTVSHVAADTLYLTRAGALSAAVPLEQIRAVEVSQGVHTARGLLRGAVAGATVGALAFGLSQAIDPSKCDYCPQSVSGKVKLYAVVGGVFGAVIGAPIGAVLEKRRWSLVWNSSPR